MWVSKKVIRKVILYLIVGALLTIFVPGCGAVVGRGAFGLITGCASILI